MIELTDEQLKAAAKIFAEAIEYDVDALIRKGINNYYDKGFMGGLKHAILVIKAESGDL